MCICWIFAKPFVCKDWCPIIIIPRKNDLWGKNTTNTTLQPDYVWAIEITFYPNRKFVVFLSLLKNFDDSRMSLHK